MSLTSIVILTFNNLEKTRRCLDSIRTFTSQPHELIIVDNGSTDGTVEFLQFLSQKDDIQFIRNLTNRGYAAGCNQGMKRAKGTQILLLNNDTVVSRNWLDNMTKALHSSQEVGMVGPLSNMTIPTQLMPATFPDDREYQRFAERFNKHDPGKWKPVQALSGFCLLLKREVLRQVGWLDERFLVGNYEDLDYSYRAIRAGITLLVAADTFVHHDGNASFRKNGLNFSAIFQENRNRFIQKWGFIPEKLLACEP